MHTFLARPLKSNPVKDQCGAPQFLANLSRLPRKQANSATDSTSIIANADRGLSNSPRLRLFARYSSKEKRYEDNARISYSSLLICSPEQPWLGK
jgi:hypothetical protein